MPTSSKSAIKEIPVKELVKVRTRLYEEPFTAELLESPAVVITLEQQHYIREILDICCSDSRFAERAFTGISLVLAGGTNSIPIETIQVTSLVPSEATIGSAMFVLHVHGTGFLPGSQINWNGTDVTTVYLGATELTTQVDLSTEIVATDYPVKVGQSNVMTFSLKEPMVLLTDSGGKKNAN